MVYLRVLIQIYYSLYFSCRATDGQPREEQLTQQWEADGTHLLRPMASREGTTPDHLTSPVGPCRAGSNRFALGRILEPPAP